MCARDPRQQYALTCVVFALLLFIFAHIHYASATYEPFTRQSGASQIASTARSMGLPESDPIIQRAKEIWWQAETQFRLDRDMIAVAIHGEAGYGCTDRHQELVGAVVYNRTHYAKLKSPSVYAVLSAPGAYAIDFTKPGSKIWQKAQADPAHWQHLQNIATKVLREEVECPTNVVFQANFKQGTGVYAKFKACGRYTYFCYGS